MTSRPQLTACLAIVAVTALLAVGLLPGSGPTPLDAQGASWPRERIDARLLTDADDEEPPSPVQFAALDEISRRVGGRPQAGFNPLNGTPRVLFARGSFLSGPSTDPPRTVARNFLLNHADLFVVSPQFVSRLTESRVFKNDNSGITHVQYEQQFEGLKVFQSTVRVAVTAEGRVLMVTADYYPELSLPSTDPVLSEDAAMDAAFAEVGPPRDLPPVESDPDPRTASMRELYTPTAELVVFPLPNKSAALAWRVEVPQFIDFWEVVVDADSGAVLYVGNHTVDDMQGEVFPEHPDASSQVPSPVEFPPPAQSLPAPRNVWVDVATCAALIDPDYPCTVGNNVWAVSDRNPDDEIVYLAADPDGHFNFGFADSYATTGNPNADELTSITNLFYLNNVAHDHFYQLGFTEAAGNFQDDNFGAGGAYGDPVLARTYTGWDYCPPSLSPCRNNAYFSVGYDGTPGEMTTFLFTNPPLAQRDPSLDGDIVIHEYGHGVSTRLVGVGGLPTTPWAQGGAMGEGWSDYFPISLYDDPVVGEYSTQNPTTGIRRYAYDNSSSLTYGDLCTGPSGCEVHDDGEIWAATLWDLRAFYVSQLGLAAGSQAADELVIEGLMLTPFSPSMLDGRDAILQAGLAMGGANQCALWEVFASRGMGYSATSAGDTEVVTEAFDLSPSCALIIRPELVGDFDGDGKDDAANYDPASGAWWVSISTGSGFDPQLWATFNTKTGWDPQLVGDFNNDGKDDIVNYHAASGTWWVNRSTGAGFVPEKWATFSTKSGWDAQLVGDFNGDRRDDVVNYHPASGTWWVNVSKAAPDRFEPQKWTTFRTKSGWDPQLVGDFTGDDRDDVVNYHAASGTWWVNVSKAAPDRFEPQKWTTFRTKTGWDPQLVGNFDGDVDGMDDVVNYHVASGRWWVNVSDGTKFTPEWWATFSSKTGWDAQLVGNFDGDVEGKDDVVNYHPASGRWWVNVSDGTKFTPQWWAAFSSKTGWDPQLVGNFDGDVDGKDDVVNYHVASGRWWVNVSTGLNTFQPQWWP